MTRHTLKKTMDVPSASCSSLFACDMSNPLPGIPQLDKANVPLFYYHTDTDTIKILILPSLAYQNQNQDL